jgi:hypothetical protein
MALSVRRYCPSVRLRRAKGKPQAPAGATAAEAANVVKIASKISCVNLYGRIIRAHLFGRVRALSFVTEHSGRGEQMYALFWTVAMIGGVLFGLGTAVHRIGALFY